MRSEDGFHVEGNCSSSFAGETVVAEKNVLFAGSTAYIEASF